MATPPQTIIVGSEAKLTSMLDRLSLVRPPTKPLDPPSLYFDIEGQDLGRHGHISIVSLFIHPENTAYLVDVHTLGGSAFTTASGDGTTLKGVLESPALPKGFFDIRNDSDALFSLFGIRVAGVHDIQLMELARRRGPRGFVSGLSKCIERDLAGAPDQAAVARALAAKQRGQALWDPKAGRGGTHAAFNARPLPPAIADYCAADVALLPALWRAYARDLVPPAGHLFWRCQVRSRTLDRIRQSQAPSYNPQAKDKARGPWEWQPEELGEVSAAWSDDMMDDYRIGDTYTEVGFGELKMDC